MITVRFAVSLLAAVMATQAQDTLPLRDGWRIQSSAKVNETGERLSRAGYDAAGWYPTSVPVTVLAALVANKVYPDPYYGLNLKSIPGYREGRWLVMPAGSPFRTPWWYRTEFSLPERFRGRNLSLRLDGINYKANVWLNGRKIAGAGDVRGMFRRFSFPIEYAPTNYLAVEIIPPGLEPDIAYTTKQIEATTGWDDHNPYPPDMNMGLWRAVSVKATGPVEINHPYVVTRLDSTAHVIISAELHNATDREAAGKLEAEVEKLRIEQEVRLAPKETRVVKLRALDIAKPRVWWPNGMGAQELYDLRLRFTSGGQVSDSAAVRFGIREATTFLNGEGWRTYQVNGKRVLIRGGAWMTSDMLLRLDTRRYEALIRYTREAHLNMLRSEGFSIRETDEFYDLCDRYGIMVTQQIFGRSIPDEQLAIDCTRDTLLRIRNHPSLVHFLGHDETYPTPTLDKAYRDMIAELTPERTYQPHSGAFDVKERLQTGGTRTGTRELWTYANPSHYYTHKEDGAWGFAQSGGIGGVAAPIESLRRMMPAKDLWPPTGEAWSFHTVIQGVSYFDALFKALEARYGKPSGIEDFCLKAQAMNYESARGMFEAYGRNKYSATGITPWKYDAAWPAALTWHYVDWYLIAGGAYYGAKKACEGLHVQYSYDDRWVWVINNTQRNFRGLKLSAQIYDFDLRERFSKTAAVEVGADSKTNVFTVEWPKDIGKTFFLHLRLGGVSDNRYWLSSVPDIEGTKGTRDGVFEIRPKSTADFTALAKLARVELNATCRFERRGEETVGRVRVENPSGTLAFLVHLAVIKGKGGEEPAPSYWDDNYFSLLPAESRELSVRLPAIETPVLRIDGWNVSPLER